MRITFVGHASVLVKAEPVSLLMDPWLQGEAFNESWALHPEPVLSGQDLAAVTHLWISHEHPDHLSIATLRSIPENLRSRITALFQRHFSDDVVKLLKSLRFKEVIELPRAKFFPLAPEVEIYCRPVGHQDSSLAVRAEGRTVLNVNDCDLPVSTMRSMRRDLGAVDVLLDQFSIAGWSGNADDIRRKEESRQGVMRKFLKDIATLEPRYVIPFASFVRFSHRENAHMNLHVNTIDDVAKRVDPTRLVVMYPGDTWDPGGPFSGTALAVERYRGDFRRIKDLPTKSHEVVPMEKVLATIDERLQDVRRRYQGLLLRWFPPVTFYLDDLKRALEVDVRREVREIALARSDCMVYVSSQAMWYTFAFRWGLPTLGVSGRMTLNSPERPFRRLKKLGALYSSKIFTRAESSILNRRFLGYLGERRGDLYSQYLQRVI
jgi:UDP-MurNAc hydroxylase